MNKTVNEGNEEIKSYGGINAIIRSYMNVQLPHMAKERSKLTLSLTVDEVEQSL